MDHLPGQIANVLDSVFVGRERKPCRPLAIFASAILRGMWQRRGSPVKKKNFS
jgi:hypothetical protein